MKLSHVKNITFNQLTGSLAALAFSCCAHGTVSAQSLQDLATPVSNPVNFEDPRITSDVRPIYVRHAIDEKFVTEGGSVDVYALQLRYALTDNLALIATKDGIVHFEPDAVLDDQTGLANVAAGAKYAFYSCDNSIATAGLRYEAPIGHKRVLQGDGSGILNPFVSAALATDFVNLSAYTGLRIALESEDSTFYDASLHADTKLGAISPLVELNLFQVLSAGDRLAIPDEGQDFFNLGAADSKDKTMLTAAAGARVELTESLSWGAVYEFPLVTGAGTRITDWRLTTDLILSF